MNFYSESKIQKRGDLNNTNVRTNFHLSLRKSRRQSNNVRKRLEFLGMNSEHSLEIDPSSFSLLPMDFLSKFNSLSIIDQLIQINTILSSPVQNEMQIAFSLYHLRKLSLNLPKTQENIIQLIFKIISTLFSEMIFNQIIAFNKEQFIYEFTYALIELNNYFINTPLDKKQIFIDKLIQIFMKNVNIYIRSNILLIFGNMILEYEKEFIEYLTSKFSYLIMISQYLGDQWEKIPTEIKWIFIWVFGLNLKYSPENGKTQTYPESYKTAIQNICSIIETNLDKTLFNESVECIRICTEKINYLELADVYKNGNLLTNIISKINLQTKTSTLESIFCILTNITFDSNDIMYPLFNLNLFGKLETILNESNNELETKKKNAYIQLLYLLYNCNNEYRIRKKIQQKNKIFKCLVTILEKTNDKEIIEETLNIFLHLLDIFAIDRNDIYFEMIGLGVPELLLNVLNNNIEQKRDEIVKKCLKCIICFLSYGKELKYNKNIFIQMYENKGLKDILEKIVIINNGETSEISYNLLNKLFMILRNVF